MKKIYFLLLLSALTFQSAVAQNEQPNPYQVAKEDGYGYRSLIKLLDMDSTFIGSKFEHSYHDLLAILYSRVGRYKEARREAEACGTQFLDNMRFKNSYKDVKAIPLSEIMDSIIANNRVIMMNERHFNPHSRAFVISWLEKCYENGYRYLAAETLFAKDSLLNERRSVLLGETGFYSNEPVYGDMLSTALNLGYTLVPYEGDGFGVDREVNEAKNLVERIISQDPEAKFLLLGGFGHIADRNGWYTMGRYFKEQSDIDPFTMECTFFHDPYGETDSLQTVYYDLIDAIKGWTLTKENKLAFVDTDVVTSLKETNGNFMYDYIRYGLEYVKLVRNILLYKVAKSLIDKDGNITNYSMDNEIVQCEIHPEDITISYDREI
jgi:tetratricopeptide (TPR) repeat protein